MYCQSTGGIATVQTLFRPTAVEATIERITVTKQNTKRFYSADN